MAHRPCNQNGGTFFGDEMPLYFPDLKEFSCPDIERRKIKGLLTPPSILKQTEFPEAEIIAPIPIGRFSNFESILAEREKIKNLKLLPVKQKEDRENYNAIKHTLISQVRELMGNHKIAYSENQFPYSLPPDTVQGLIWIQQGFVGYQVSQFITRLLKALKVTPDQVVIFERPKNTTSSLVKGTFPEVRHIHIWHKKIDFQE